MWLSLGYQYWLWIYLIKNVWKEGTIVTYKTRTERQFLSSRGELLYAIFVGLWKVLQKKDSAGAFCAPTLVYNLLTTKNTAIDCWTAHPLCPSATLVSDPSRLILTTLFVNILSHAEHFITNIQFRILRIQWFMGRWAGAVYSYMMVGTWVSMSSELFKYL